MTKDSVIGIGKAKELFAQLDQNNFRNVASASISRLETTINLRYCYNCHGPTGGLVLFWWTTFEDYNLTKKHRGTIRIKADMEKKMRLAVSRAITRIYREVLAERQRYYAVKQLHDYTEPLAFEPHFSQYVAGIEGKLKLNPAYNEMTEEEVEAWFPRIASFKARLVG